MEDKMKIVKSLEESDYQYKELVKLLVKQKSKKVDYWMLLGILAANIFRNALAGRNVIRAGKGTIREGQDF